MMIYQITRKSKLYEIRDIDKTTYFESLINKFQPNLKLKII